MYIIVLLCVKWYYILMFRPTTCKNIGYLPSDLPTHPGIPIPQKYIFITRYHIPRAPSIHHYTVFTATPTPDAPPQPTFLHNPDTPTLKHPDTYRDRSRRYYPFISKISRYLQTRKLANPLVTIDCFDIK